jgi:hypothetical protein
LLLHTWSFAHCVPHAPQLFGSLFVLTQSPLQSVSVGSHAPAQVPPLQNAVAPEHDVVHEPQCVLSVSRSTQTPLHAVSPGPQQMPLVHVSPLPHARPQPPQFASSVSGSEHVPLQLFSLAVQHATVVPVVGGLHDSPIAVLQLAPHAPQFVLSASRLHAPPQFASPLPQHAAGVPDKQLSPVPHVVPHMPQFASSLWVSLHMPVQHVSVPPHAIAHEPQFVSSLCRSTHVPLQFVWPIGQHFVRPLSVWQVPVPQSLPHEPQFVLLDRSTHVPPQFISPAAQHSPL